MKRVPVYLSEYELKHIINALEEMPWSTEDVDSEKLGIRLKEELDTFSEE